MFLLNAFDEVRFLCVFIHVHSSPVGYLRVSVYPFLVKGLVPETLILFLPSFPSV